MNNSVRGRGFYRGAGLLYNYNFLKYIELKRVLVSIVKHLALKQNTLEHNTDIMSEFGSIKDAAKPESIDGLNESLAQFGVASPADTGLVN